MKTERNKSDYERCCVCHKIVNIPKQTPVWERTAYVEGAGQLCKDCFRELYGKV